MTEGSEKSIDDESTQRIGETLVLTTRGGSAFARLKRDVTLETDEAVSRALGRLRADEVTVDFGRASSCPTIIVGALVQLAQRVPRVTLRNAGPLMRESLDVMHVASYFTFEDVLERPDEDGGIDESSNP